jgi:sulfonate transport system ATP-binding protein
MSFGNAVRDSRAETPWGGVSPAAVQLRGIGRHFGERSVLAELDLEIPAGQFVALLGASGSGKTSLLRILAGLDEPDDGEVLVPRARTVVFQEPRLVLSKRVWRNVTIGLRASKATKQAALTALSEVGLGHLADVWPATLSGGEAQRVALARALVREPQLLLLDEPLAALDALTRLHMQRLIAELCRQHNPTVLFVTHDVDEAIRLADRILVLSSGRISLDEQVAIPRPRVLSDPPVDQLRHRLLAELGVREENKRDAPALSGAE